MREFVSPFRMGHSIFRRDDVRRTKRRLTPMCNEGFSTLTDALFKRAYRHPPAPGPGHSSFPRPGFRPWESEGLRCRNGKAVIRVVILSDVHQLYALAGAPLWSVATFLISTRKIENADCGKAISF
jgi:hypothetical protein